MPDRYFKKFKRWTCQTTWLPFTACAKALTTTWAALACPAADSGSKIRLTIGSETREAVVPAASAPEIALPHRDDDGKARYRNRDWQTLKLGKLKLPRGAATLTLEPLLMPGSQVMDLKHVKLFRH